MNWINNVVRPKIRGLWQKREMPENLWVKCPETGQMVFHRDLEANQFVVPGSGYHMRIGAEARLKGLFDGGKFEVVPIPEVAIDPLKFRDEKRYSDRLKEARAKTGMSDAMLTGAWHAGRPVHRRGGAGFLLHGRIARHGGWRGDHRGHVEGRRA